MDHCWEIGHVEDGVFYGKAWGKCEVKLDSDFSLAIKMEKGKGEGPSDYTWGKGLLSTILLIFNCLGTFWVVSGLFGINIRVFSPLATPPLIST